MPLRLSAALLLTLACAAPLSAQPAGAVMPDQHLLLLGGVTPDPDRPHLSAGLAAGAAWNGWGVEALGMGGRGGEYESLLLGLAASRRVARGERWSLQAFAGYGFYGERGPTQIERDSRGVLLGATARWRVGPISLAAVYSHLTGRYDEPDVTSPFRVNVPRVALGVGF
jgi:hypothetical protein